jgi:hypothetical protein
MLWASSSWASYLDDFYNSADLGYWQSRYCKNINTKLNDVLLTHLTGSERRAVGAVKLYCPLIAAEQTIPINFYAMGNPPRIVAPALSIKFLDDLAIASAWLLQNGYSQSTVYNYLSMIKYRRASEMPRGRFPPPLTALRIPDGVLNDADIYSLSEKIFGSALLFVLAHELGHIRYKHPGYNIPLEQAKENELEADAFAVELLRRIGLPPLGVTHFFMASTYLGRHRGDFVSDADWEHYLRTEYTHPVSTHRLRILSQNLKQHARDFARGEPNYANAVNQINYAAGQLEGIAKILSDYDMQKMIAHIGRTTDLSSLKPVAEGRLYSESFEEENHLNAPGPFNGVYRGNFSSGPKSPAVSISVLFKRNGNRVSGKYTYGAGRGELYGVLKGDTLYFQWKEGPGFGKGVFNARNHGMQFDGTWGFKESAENGGVWNGKKRY